jgi:NADH-quinone oxidoreductase subunit J
MFFPFLLIICQLIIGSFCLYFFGYFPVMWMLQNFWNISIHTLLPIIVLGGISISFFVKNPVWALLYILFSFILLGIFLLNIGIEFITFFFIIVYLGALMMLFLFVIMLFNLQQLSQTIKTKNIQMFLFQIFMLFIIAYNISIIIIQNFEQINITPLYFFAKNNYTDFNLLFNFNTFFNNNALIFKTLYTNNSIFFIIITLILLYALIGALTVISLVKKTKNNNV